MIYLGQPYSGTPDEMQFRYEEAVRMSALLLKKGKHPYSPIAHWHNVATQIDLPKDFDFWQHNNKHMLKLSGALYIFRLSGWKYSKGLFNETAYAIDQQKPVFMLSLSGHATMVNANYVLQEFDVSAWLK